MAVYTNVTNEELSDFISKYNIEKIIRFNGIKSGTSNSNYLLETEKRKLILTLFEERTNQENLPFFFDLMNHLNSANIKCPEVIKDQNDNFSNRLNGKHAVITSFMSGKSIDQIQPSHCSSLGATVAKMHNESAKIKIIRENELGFFKLQKLLEKLESLNSLETETIKFLNEEYYFLYKELNKNLPSGIIHADLFPDNIFFDGNELTGIIDFYFSCNDFYAYEIAICLNAWCFELNNNEFNPTKAKHLLKSYNEYRKFSIEEVDALPLLTRASALRYLLTRLIDFHTHADSELILKKNPNEYLLKLKFHQTVKKASEYGL